METKNTLQSNLPPAYFIPVELKNNATSKAALLAARDCGEKLAGSLAGNASFAQILAKESEKHRRILELRQTPRDEEKKTQAIL